MAKDGSASTRTLTSSMHFNEVAANMPRKISASAKAT